MDLQEEFAENKRRLDNGEINEDEFHKRRKSILEKWSGESKKTKQVELSRADNKPKPKEMDLYTILQLQPDATEAEIKSSYKRLALKHHPDKNDGIVTEEWEKLSMAYQILSDENTRSLYDNHGTINDSLAGKTALNQHVGGDPWKPYIGNIEIGVWIFSFTNNEAANQNSPEQKERRHAIRVSSIVRYLQNKLSQFPKQNNSEFDSFLKSLHQEARKLSEEPNGKELLSTLGEIYISEAQSMSSKPSTFLNKLGFFVDLFSGYLATRNRSNRPNLDEISKIVWKISRTEISSIAREACDKVLDDKSLCEDESHHLANSLQLLGEVWLEVSNKLP